MNRKNLFFLIVLSSLLIQGCTSGSIFNNSKTPIGANEDDDIGNGVEMKISSIDDSKLITTGSIFFDFEMKNKNIDPIEISKENLRITTDPSNVISSESIGYMKDRIFKGENSVFLNEQIYIDEEVSLDISPDEKNNDKGNLGQEISLRFNLEFNEKFEYFSNLNVNFDKSKINSQNVIKKKGPFDLHSFELKNGNSKKIISFNIKGFTNSERKITFSNIDVLFGDNSLGCKQTYSNGEFIERPILGNQDDELLLVCNIPDSQIQEYLYDNTEFTFNVNLDYEFQEVILQKFELPLEFRE